LTVASNVRVPELVAGVDVRALPLSALEGFVLSRIDGRSSTADIVSLTGLPLDQVVQILDKLSGLGAVRFRDAEAQPGPPSGPGPRRAEGQGTGVHAAPARRRPPSHTPAGHQRRILSESGVSSPPPEMKHQSNRPRADSGAPNRAASAVSPSNRPATPASGEAGARRNHSNTSLPPVPSHPPSSMHRATSTQAMPPVAPASLAPSMAPEVPKYDLRELDEEVDLPMARRKQVLDLFYRLSELDHYEALGVAYHAEKKEIRSAYFQLSKAFHPDSMFRKNLGSFKAKMVAVFQVLTEAYETLGKQKARDEYDTYLRTTKSARMAERALQFAANVQATALVVPPAPILPNIVEPKSASSEPAPLPPPSPPKEVSAEARRLAQEVIGRRLRGAMPGTTRQATTQSSASTFVPNPPTPPASPPPTSDSVPNSGFGESPRTDTQDLLKRLTRSLRDVGQLTGSNDGVTRAVRASQAALDRGDLSEATQQAARAASLAPERPELKMQHGKLSAQLSEKLANTYIEQAKFEMKHGKWASAALTWTKVCEGRPNDGPAHRHAAMTLLKAGGDMRGAQRYAQRAVFLAPNDIEARCLLAQICLTVGLKLNARRELEAAAKLDPANEMVKNLLADLEKS
jgi:Flp pilus assembly protein TadD